MYEGSIEGKKIGKRDEVYPTGVTTGYPGYNYDQAVAMKEEQRKIMEESSKTVEIIIEIKPARCGYYVRNRSTYVCDF